MPSDLELLREVAAEIDAVGQEHVGGNPAARSPAEATGFLGICQAAKIDPTELVDFIRERETHLRNAPFLGHFPTILMMGIGIAIAYEKKRSEA